MGGVRTNAVMAATVSDSSLSGDRDALVRMLAGMKSELSTLDAGGVDEEATNPAAVRKFRKDCGRLSDMRGRIRHLEEVAYKAGEGRNASSRELKELRDAYRRLNEDVERVKYAVDRLTQVRWGVRGGKGGSRICGGV